MKIKCVLLSMILLLSFAACGGSGEEIQQPTSVDASNPLNLPATPTPPKAERPSTKTAVVMKEGLEETVTYTLVKGEGWSFYMTEGDWQTAGENVWSAVYNKDVTFWVAAYPGQSAEEVKQTLMGEGFDDTLFQNEGSFRYAAAFDGFAFIYDMPAHSEYAEGWGVTLAAMAQTFIAEE